MSSPLTSANFHGLQHTISQHQVTKDSIDLQIKNVRSEVEAAASQNQSSMITTLQSVAQDWEDTMTDVGNQLAGMMDCLSKAGIHLRNTAEDTKIR